MDVTELKKATQCCIKMDCLQCPLGTVIGCDQKLANEVMTYIEDLEAHIEELEERIAIMQADVDAYNAEELDFSGLQE